MKRPVARGPQGPWRRLPSMTGVGEGSRRPSVLSEQHRRRERPVAQDELDARQPWKRWSSGESIEEIEAPTHPYLACQMSDFRFRQPLRGSNSGVRAKNSTSLVCLPPISLPSAMNSKEMGHSSYPGSGHFAGVKPYSCFVVDLPRGAEDELVQRRTTSGGVFLSSSELVRVKWICFVPLLMVVARFYL